MVEKPSQAFPQKDPTQSPSKIEPHNASPVDKFFNFVGKGIMSPQVNQFTDVHDNCHQELHTSQMQISKQDIVNSPGRKRRSEEIVLNGVDIGLVGIQRSPKIHKGGGYDPRSLVELSDRSTKQTEMIGGYMPSKDWADVCLQFTMLLYLIFLAYLAC